MHFLYVCALVLSTCATAFFSHVCCFVALDSAAFRGGRQSRVTYRARSVGLSVPPAPEYVDEATANVLLRVPFYACAKVSGVVAQDGITGHAG